MKLKAYFILYLLVLPLVLTAQNKPVPKENVKADPLPSWNEGPSKKAIIDFVTKTTKTGSPDFIPGPDRIACFDNDGTLWSEQPMYFQLAFAIDRIKVMAPEHPEWKDQQPYKALLEGDLKTALAGGEHAIMQIIFTTHSNMSTDEFSQLVTNWIATAEHPKTGKKYIEMTYLPMMELLRYLRANSYKTFIVSGGGVDFMRAWTEKVYGIPSYQVIGSSAKVQYQVTDSSSFLTKLPEVNFIDDKEGKVLGIYQFIGKRPVFSVGNSDGDYAMLQYTTTGTGYPRFGMLIHHTDDVRESAYDRKSSIGKLEQGLDDAAKNKWQIVDMKKEWKKVFMFDK